LKITVIIPTYNEAENLPKIRSAVFALPLTDISLLIVDDNSPDGTGSLADEFHKEFGDKFNVLHRSGKLGLGSAYIQGFRWALEHGADAVAQMDADFSHPPEKLVELAEAIQNCDMVIGSRYTAGGSLDERWPAWRKALSAWGNFYARTILGMHNRDVTGGFRLWRREALQRMPLDKIRSNGYVFQVELTYIATRLGFRIKEVPIHFADRRWGTSKMSLRIQIEAALRVWTLPFMYRNLNK